MMRTVAFSMGSFLLGILLTLALYPGAGIGSERIQPHVSFSVAGAQEITCTYPQLVAADFSNGEVNHALPDPESHAMIFTFSDLNGEIGKLKYIDSTQTISETPIVKLNEDEEKIVYVDGTGNNYLSTHMIFKNSGVAVYTKAVSILGIPSGSLAVGTCIGI